ncbi:MAG: helix-turn-helix transcriptional regulator [Methylococcales bacterium]|nr:helix-turn-helix transcriptional regulator [Methylococcales bacterium]
MKLGEKVSLMRTLKGLTQEEMAVKLNMSTTGYAKIERGETKLQNPRLEKIAGALGIELKDLLNFDAQNVFKASFHDQCLQYSQNIYINSAIELTQELEKMRVKLDAKDREVELLSEQVNQLKDIITLMKNVSPSQ